MDLKLIYTRDEHNSIIAKNRAIMRKIPLDIKEHMEFHNISCGQLSGLIDRNRGYISKLLKVLEKNPTQISHYRYLQIRTFLNMDIPIEVKRAMRKISEYNKRNQIQTNEQSEQKLLKALLEKYKNSSKT